MLLQGLIDDMFELLKEEINPSDIIRALKNYEYDNVKYTTNKNISVKHYDFLLFKFDLRDKLSTLKKVCKYSKSACNAIIQFVINDVKNQLLDHLSGYFSKSDIHIVGTRVIKVYIPIEYITFMIISKDFIHDEVKEMISSVIYDYSDLDFETMKYKVIEEIKKENCISFDTLDHFVNATNLLVKKMLKKAISSVI